MELEKKINEGIMEAMKARDEVRRDTLRNVKKFIVEAKKAVSNVEVLPDADVLKIISKLAKQGADTAAIYKGQGRDDLYVYEMAQVEVLREYLPAMMSPEQLTEAVREIISRAGAGSMKDMGRVMGIAAKELAGKADGADISSKVRELLG